jgi:hypothetical protein
LAEYAQLQAIQAGRQAQELNALKMQEAQAALEERNALRSLNPSSEDYESQLFKVSPQLGIQFRREAATTAAQRAAQQKSEFDLTTARRKFAEDLRRGLSANPSDENIIAFGQDALLQNLYTPDQVKSEVSRLLALPVPDRVRILSQAGASAADLRPQVIGGRLVSSAGNVLYAAPSAIGAVEEEIATLRGQGVADTDPRIVARQGKIRQLSGAPGPTEIANIEAEIATLKGQGVADTDPRIVARQGKIRQLSGAPGPTEIANVEAEVAALKAQGVPDTDPRITARVNKIRQLSGAPGPTEIAVLETEIAALKAQGVADTDPRIVTRRGKIEQLASGANSAMVVDYKFAQTPAGGNFRGTFQQFITTRAAAGRAPAQPVAPTITTVEDPTSPGKFLQVDARVYRGGGRGSPGVIGVARPSAAAEKAATQRAQLSRDLDSAIRELTEITKDGGLIDQSTGSGAGRLVDIGARFVGRATPGDIAIGKIAPVADLALKMVPRFEGPQSNADTASYKEAAGQLADATLPTAIRKEAGKTVLRLMSERKNQFVTIDMAAEGAGAAPSSNAPDPLGIR